MTYSLDFRKQVLKSLDDGMTFAEAAEFYNLSPTTIQNWKRRVHSKTTRQTKPYKIPAGDFDMKKSRFTDTQIVNILKQSEQGVLNRPDYIGE